MAETDDQHRQLSVVEHVDHAIITNPDTQQLNAAQLLGAGWAGVFGQGVNRRGQASLYLGAKLTELPMSRRCELNLIGHGLELDAGFDR